MHQVWFPQGYVRRDTMQRLVRDDSSARLDNADTRGAVSEIRARGIPKERENLSRRAPVRALARSVRLRRVIEQLGSTWILSSARSCSSV